MYYRVLIVDDDNSILSVLKTLLQREGYDVVTADSSDKGYNLLRNEEFDMMLSDIVMQPFDGITLLQQARKVDPDIPVIMMTGFASIETAKKAMRIGAFDYICKPFKIDELKEVVQRATTYLKRLYGVEEEEGLKKVTLIKRHFKHIVGESSVMEEIYGRIQNIAAADDPVLIYGPSGVGKSLVAKAIHVSSKRHAAPMLTFNCAVYPDSLIGPALFGYVQLPTDDEGNVIKGLPKVTKGILERADGGTVHFEQIGALPLEFQEKMLHVIREKKLIRGGQNREVDVNFRLIGDTIENLETKVKRDEFSSDLYECLRTNYVEVPKLNERDGDVDLLLNFYLLQYNKQENKSVELDKKAHHAMSRYSWPGNIGELISAVYRAARDSDGRKIDVRDLPAPIRNCAVRDKSNIFGYSDELDLRWQSLKKFIKSKEKEYVEQVLKVTKGDKEKAAQMMGLDIKTFMKKYGNECFG